MLIRPVNNWVPGILFNSHATDAGDLTASEMIHVLSSAPAVSALRAASLINTAHVGKLCKKGKLKQFPLEVIGSLN